MNPTVRAFRFGSITKKLALVAFVVVASSLAACGGGGSSGGGISPTPTTSPGTSPFPAGSAAPVGATTLFIANSGSASIITLPASGTGIVSPITTITGNLTLLNQPSSLTLDAADRLWTTDFTAAQPIVLAFPSAANGDVAPDVVLSSTSMIQPAAVAVDATGTIYVADYGSNSVLVFAAGSNGVSTPIRTIQGSNTMLVRPHGITLDASGNIWVASTDAAAILEFANSANGNVAPIRSISGSATLLSKPNGVSFDVAGNIYVSNVTPPADGSINIYAASASGNAGPIGQYTAADYVGTPYGIAIDSLGYVYVGDEGTPGSVRVYPPGTLGGTIYVERFTTIFTAPEGITVR